MYQFTTKLVKYDIRTGVINMSKIQLLCFSTALISSVSLWAANNTNSPQTQPLGDNPSLGRVLLYKSGQGIKNLGDSIQGASENTSSKISEKWQDTKQYTSHQTEKAKSYTEQKWQDTKDAIVGSHDVPAPIERNTLSQPSSNP